MNRTPRRLKALAAAVLSVAVIQRLGREGLAESPDDVFYVYWLAVGLRSAELGGSPPRSASPRRRCASSCRAARRGRPGPPEACSSW